MICRYELETKQINVLIICNKYTLLQLGERYIISNVFEVLMYYFAGRRNSLKKVKKFLMRNHQHTISC